MMDNTINDTRLEAQLDAAAAGYTPDNNSIPAEVWAAIAGDTQAQQHIDDDDCYRTKSLTSYDDENFDRMYPDQITLGKLPVYHPYGPGAVLECDADRHVAEPVIVNPSDGYSWRPSQMLTDPFNDDIIDIV